MKYKEILETLTSKDEIIEIILSNKASKELEYKKIEIKPFLKEDEINYQITYYYDKKNQHENISKGNLSIKFESLFDNFKQAVIFSTNKDYQLLRNKKGSVKLIENKASKKKGSLLHNRQKNYILPENKPCKFLEVLGIMNKDGRVFKEKYDKFRQINKYLEFIRDLEADLKKNKKLRIVDFGSGKAYLSFALYYYIREVLDLEVEIYGIDLKKDVVDFCNETSKKLGFKNLHFYCGDIQSFNKFENIDMIVTLHACDIATDMAIAHGINWKSKFILVVPCCQHELFKQIDNKLMSPLLRQGILKERLSSLVTDSSRGLLLEANGYEVQFIEFIDMEHTAKNIMIRAVFKNKDGEKALEEYKEYKEFWNINPYLEKILKN